MRISDWSSDVCSSDLGVAEGAVVDPRPFHVWDRRSRALLLHADPRTLFISRGRGQTRPIDDSYPRSGTVRLSTTCQSCRSSRTLKDRHRSEERLDGKKLERTGSDRWWTWPQQKK